MLNLVEQGVLAADNPVAQYIHAQLAEWVRREQATRLWVELHDQGGMGSHQAEQCIAARLGVGQRTVRRWVRGV